MTKIGVPLLVAAVALRDAEGRVLVQRRPAGSSLAGLWEFPGGKLEPGETPEAALVRELGEELGIAVDPEALAPIAFSTALLDGGRPLILMLFGCTSWAGEPRPLQADMLHWASPEKLGLLPMPPADRPLLAALIGR